MGQRSKNIICTAVCVIACILSGTAVGAPSAFLPGMTIRLDPIADIPGSSGGPNSLTHAGDGSGRSFVVAQGGLIHAIQDGSLQSTPYLDLSGLVPLIDSGERGLLGMAFHPNFAGDSGSAGYGKLYTYTSETKAGTADFNHPELVAGLGDHHSVIREWSVDPAAPAAVDVGLPDLDQPIGLEIRHRLEHDRLEHAEDGHVGSDSDSQGEDDHQREERSANDLPKPVSQVAYQVHGSLQFQ